MYKGYIEKKFKEFQVQPIYLPQEFQKNGGEGNILMDVDIVKQLEQFIKKNMNQGNEHKIQQFIRMFSVQLLLPLHIVDELLSNTIEASEQQFEEEAIDLIQRQSINRVREQTQVEEVRFITQLQLLSEQKPEQELFVEEIQEAQLIVPLANLKQYPLGRTQFTIRAKLFNKPIIEKEQLQVIGDYSLQFRDDSGMCSVFFTKNRIKEKFQLYYENLQVQTIYDISEMEIHQYKQTYEIKVTSTTQFKQYAKVPVLEQLQSALSYNLKNGEEIIVAGMVAEIGELRQQNKKIIIYTLPIDSNTDYYKIPLILWDHHKLLSFKVGDVYVFEGVLLKVYTDVIELKSLRTRFKVYTEEDEKYQDIIKLIMDKKHNWLQPNNQEIQIEQVIQQPLFLSDIHSPINYPYFNTVVKILKDKPAIFQMKTQKCIKQIIVTSDNNNSQTIELIGDRLCQKIYISEQALIFISNLQFINDKIVASEHNTQIRVLPDDDIDFAEQIALLKQPFSKPLSLSLNELEQDVQINVQKKNPIKIKINQKLSYFDNQKCVLSESLKKGIDRDELMDDIIPLLEGKMHKSRFNVLVQIDELFEVRYQKGNVKLQDLRISDESNSGKITLWNNQISDYKIGQTIRIDNIFYDQSKQEFKTSFHTKVFTNVPNKNLPNKQRRQIQKQLVIEGIEYQNFTYNQEVKLITDIIKLQCSLSEELPYQYCRAMISEILIARLSQQCPQCNFTKLVQNNDVYECSGQNGIKHIVTLPKIFCYLKCKLTDFTASIEVVFGDEICQQYIPQNSINELYKNQMTVVPYFDCLMYKEFTFKLWLQKQKDQDMKKIKIMKLFQTNYLKIIDSYL
ncbi:unnamed protein product (macronuclear) [Paramecium tetraurelia]|uniref:Telomeric single stranded DNA binding POT1/Cdc13 domain-containing protein n=1 Tax=Paramecium tetraurelia TaxID=5888 RepID=A0DTY9_PARTE|nr:uncharacterized protein GSPATT00020190001 [Paramecium tetraurelia]CAK86506.1 unnamed protein product [Paramecium tetraurelia]|eukprot:XP_001453903.1 hypothetical protein (macronuclear) [Paramecium tetraurelia strain d4-2]